MLKKTKFLTLELKQFLSSQVRLSGVSKIYFENNLKHDMLIFSLQKTKVNADKFEQGNH